VHDDDVAKGISKQVCCIVCDIL